ncbi:MAG: hypothetical protein ACKPGB_09620, partial [Dolichospermum sp.]
VSFMSILITTVTQSKIAFAQVIDIGTPINTSISANNGKFIFNNFIFYIEAGIIPYINGSITNNTNKDWITAKFELILYSEKNEIISKTTFSVDRLKRGETTTIGPFKQLYFLQEEIKKAKKYEVKFVNGNFGAKYRINMTKPVLNKDLNFEDKYIKISWIFSEDKLGFVLNNKTKNPIKIDWNQVSYIDTLGNAEKVIHQGVKYVNRNEFQTPTIIPPTAKIQDIIFPSNNISYVSGKHGFFCPSTIFS